MRQRIIVCPVIQNNGEFLLCKMASDRGVFPGQGRCLAVAWNRVKRWKPR